MHDAPSSIQPDGGDVTAPDCRVLTLRTARGVCGVPLAHVVEVMRPLPLEPLSGAPAGVAGLAIIRGRAIAVIDLGELLGRGRSVRVDSTRFVTVRTGERMAALMVEAVGAVRSFAGAELDALPPLWQGADVPAVSALGLLDRELLIVLETARLLPGDWRVPAQEGASA